MVTWLADVGLLGCARRGRQTLVLLTSLLAGTSIFALLCSTPATCLASPPGVARGSFKEREAQEFVRSLLEDHRYVEAISYLRMELESAAVGRARLSMLLLLADCQIEIGDWNGAWDTLAEAEGLAVEPSAKQAVADRKSRFSDVETFVPPSSPADLGSSSGKTRADTADAQRPLEAFVTNSFFETDLRQVLTDLSFESGIPIVWDATVEGLVTYEAAEQPLGDVLKAILLPAGYTFRWQDGIYYVGSPGPEDPAFGLLSATDVVTLSNIQAHEAVSLLSDYFKPFVKASESANMVCITAPPATLERILQDLGQLDEPPLQILIEVVVTEISSDALRKMGLDWQLTHSTSESSWEVGTDHTDIRDAALLGKYAEAGIEIGERAVDLAASLEMLLDTGDAKIRANPRITTLNGRTAEIGLTKDQYFIIATSVSQYYQYNTLQSISSGIKLEITPYASAMGMITVYVKPEVGDVIGSGAEGLPEITTRTASTSVRVKDGETFAIGGLNIQNEKIRQRKIPLLGSIPLLGYLFRYDERQFTDTEIIIFVTPRILRG